MSTIVNNPGDGRDGNSGIGWVIAIVALLVLLFLIFFVFAEDNDAEDRLENVPQQVENTFENNTNGGNGSEVQGGANLTPPVVNNFNSTTTINATTTDQ